MFFLLHYLQRRCFSFLCNFPTNVLSLIRAVQRQVHSLKSTSISSFYSRRCFSSRFEPFGKQISCLIWWRITFLGEKHHWLFCDKAVEEGRSTRVFPHRSRRRKKGTNQQRERERERRRRLFTVAILNTERKRNLLFSMRTRYLFLTSRKNNTGSFASSSSSSSSSSSNVLYLLKANRIGQVKTNRDSLDRLLSHAHIW